MPLKLFQRGNKWWIRGRVDGVDGYLKRSLGTSDCAVAEAKKAEIERRARQRAILGDDAPTEADELTFAAAIMLYKAKPAEAKFLIKVVPHIGGMKVKAIKPTLIRNLGATIYPKASVDTWRRQVVTPICAVINNAHQLGKANPIRVKTYTSQERTAQDEARGKQSRQAKTPGSWEWLLAFQLEANRYLSAMALFMFTTGARVSQAIGVKPSDLDFEKGRIWMPAAKGHPAQWVSLMPEMVETLKKLPARNGRVFGYQQRWGVYKAWKSACARAGIEYLPPHSAGRHGFGTELIVRQGLDPRTVADQGRWSSPHVLLDTYTHSENGTLSVRSAFARGRGAAMDKTGTSPKQKKC
ncbi:phage integrase family protein [Breoghania corrubedonensis]|uniref:Phage integrase family protein n=1 Tax=Breoghania corrubedonensis TaxID=665038 RepID=A0A2T5VE81_9HYPH|nr:tyrosine-type recombinase/integrase [Breoghania corrubedonensis]PTW62058.1 phage integrase family protein [Breoghania corrubedonensis]